MSLNAVVRLLLSLSTSGRHPRGWDGALEDPLCLVLFICIQTFRRHSVTKAAIAVVIAVAIAAAAAWVTILSALGTDPFSIEGP